MTAEPARVERLADRRDAVAQLARLQREAELRAVSVGRLPAAVNLTLYQGDDFFLHVIVDTSQGVDLTSYLPKAQVRTAPGATSVLAEFEATILDQATIALHLPGTESAKLQTSAAWDVQVTDTTGIISTLAAGTVTIVKQVTQ